MLSSRDIRQQFIDFFAKKHGHTFVPSSPVVPLDDPTLLFSNAGMNQFKDVFLGTGSRPYTRAVNTQKCIRAGGKHNDLDDVGKDTYHHTFFEMLGNWSFGDYFKRDAIAWAWELLTEAWKIDAERLHITIFGGDEGEGLARDDEAAQIWRDVCGVPAERIHLGSKKDNFWEMGATGPCGPCTEIHIDRTPDKSGGKLVNAGVPEVMEIWNLVFIQFNRGADGKLTPLPAKHVDTGMGFERVSAVLQGKDSNYDTDVFVPIFEAIQRVTGASPYGGKLEAIEDIAYRVIADHIRALTFAITDGAVPSNTQRGFVLRSILRRAERYGWQYFGTKGPFLHQLVPTVVELMGDAFPELRRAPERVQAVILDEEKSFLQTLERGIKLFQEAAEEARAAGSGTLSGKAAFDLHTEQGVYIDITTQMALEAGLKVDRASYDELLAEFKAKSRESTKKQFVSAIDGVLPKTDDSAKYVASSMEVKLLGWVKDNRIHTSGSWQLDEPVALLVDRTCFYGEQGGQVGDAGFLQTATGRFAIEDTQRLGDAILHLGQLEAGHLEVGQQAALALATSRADIQRNHTSTHLMNLALRDVLGNHVEQKGSLVDADKTRFDFTHAQALTPEELQKVEEHVNRHILANLAVRAWTVPLADAKKLPGVRAVFGEKYPDPVRVITIGPESLEQTAREHSVEFCGGTHARATGEAGHFKIVSQEAVAKGIRRLTAITGTKAQAAIANMSGVLGQLGEALQCKPEALPARVQGLLEQVAQLQHELAAQRALALTGIVDQLLAESERVGDAQLIVGEVPTVSSELLRSQVDRLRQKVGSSIIALGWKDGDKAGLLVAVTDDLVKRGHHAGKLVGEFAKLVDGKGGGNPTLAQVGGKLPAQIPHALAQAKQQLTAKLSG